MSARPWKYWGVNNVPVPAEKLKAKLVFREDRCKGCGLCVLTCPLKLLVVSQRLNNQGYPVAELTDPEKCNSAAPCARRCARMW